MLAQTFSAAVPHHSGLSIGLRLWVMGPITETQQDPISVKKDGYGKGSKRLRGTGVRLLSKAGKTKAA